MFIPTNKTYNLGDEVFMLLSLMADAEKIPVAGIGVQFFDQDNGAVRNKIEAFLAGGLKSDRPTHTI